MKKLKSKTKKPQDKDAPRLYSDGKHSGYRIPGAAYCLCIKCGKLFDNID